MVLLPQLNPADMMTVRLLLYTALVIHTRDAAALDAGRGQRRGFRVHGADTRFQLARLDCLLWRCKSSLSLRLLCGLRLALAERCAPGTSGWGGKRTAKGREGGVGGLGGTPSPLPVVALGCSVFLRTTSLLFPLPTVNALPLTCVVPE